MGVEQTEEDHKFTINAIIDKTKIKVERATTEIIKNSNEQVVSDLNIEPDVEKARNESDTN